MYGDSRYYGGHRHVVCVIEGQGVKERFEVDNLHGPPDLGPHMSNIFHARDSFFLYQGASLNQPATHYEWQTDHFERLPPGALTDLDLENKRFPLGDDDLPDAEGWETVISVRGYDRSPEFRWNNATCLIEATQSGETVDVSLRVRDPHTEWTASLAQVDLTRRVVEQINE